jgi:hypothetical protein
MITKIKYKDVKGSLPSLELMKLYSAGMKTFPGSKKHREILDKIKAIQTNH